MLNSFMNLNKSIVEHFMIVKAKFAPEFELPGGVLNNFNKNVRIFTGLSERLAEGEPRGNSAENRRGLWGRIAQFEPQ